ncbi:MAG: protein kinase [Alistipes sp.]|nr:protein kinase [Alistipes sp.]
MNYPEELEATYEILEQIGEGGGGIIYKAVHKRLQKTVVLKKIRSKISQIETCRVEVDILKNLRNVHLPQVFDFIECEEGIFTVMEFIPGKSLRQLLDEQYVFTEKEALEYIEQLCEALEYLHENKPAIVHGDIKPDNVIRTPEGKIYLIDFNISGSLIDGKARVYGYTNGYSAPEHIEAFKRAYPIDRCRFCEEDEVTEVLRDGSDELIDVTLVSGEYHDISREPSGILIDKRADVFSIGATLYRILTGHKLEIVDNKVNMYNISKSMQELLVKTLKKNPAERIQDGTELLKAVQEVRSGNKGSKSKAVNRRSIHYVDIQNTYNPKMNYRRIFAFGIVFAVIICGIILLSVEGNLMNRLKRCLDNNDYDGYQNLLGSADAEVRYELSEYYYEKLDEVFNEYKNYHVDYETAMGMLRELEAFNIAEYEERYSEVKQKTEKLSLSREAFERGKQSEENDNYLEACKAYEAVIEEDDNYLTAQAKLERMKRNYMVAIYNQAVELFDQKEYERAADVIDKGLEYLEGNEDLVRLKNDIVVKMEQNKK